MIDNIDFNLSPDDEQLLTEVVVFGIVLFGLEKTSQNFQKEWTEFVQEIRTENRFTPEHNIVDKISSFLTENPFILRENSTFYRARNGVKNDIQKYLDSFESAFEYLKLIFDEKQSSHFRKLIRQYQQSQFWGFDAQNSSAPAKGDSAEGRANPSGISYLYGALDVDTAIQEIKPSISDNVSVATLNTLKELKLADFRSSAFEKEKNSLFSGKDLSQAFSKLYTGDHGSYLPTQFLTEKIKKIGFDGLIYFSSLRESGVNITIFNPENCIPVCSEIYSIRGISYITEKIYPMNEEMCKEILYWTPKRLANYLRKPANLSSVKEGIRKFFMNYRIDDK